VRCRLNDALECNCSAALRPNVLLPPNSAGAGISRVSRPLTQAIPYHTDFLRIIVTPLMTLQAGLSLAQGHRTTIELALKGQMIGKAISTTRPQALRSPR
jgi:hypothetical protein